MQKSLFSRYFYMCAAIILVSIILIGVVLLSFSAQFFKQDRTDMLARNARQAASLTAENYLSNGSRYVDSQTVLRAYSILANAIGAEIFLVDAQGNTLLCTEQADCVHESGPIGQGILSIALSDGYREVGRLGGLYKNLHYSVGIPVTVGGTALGSVFVSAPADDLTAFLMEILRMFLLGAACVMALACVIIYFATSRLVKPLRCMAQATASFAAGDFSVRVPVEGADEIEKLAVAFNNMASSLAVLESTRRSFVANVSHELKTPMTSIGGFIDGILDGTIPPEKHDHYLKIVSSEVKRLSRLVVSMLELARIEAGQTAVKLQSVDVNDIVCRILFGFDRQIEEKKIEIRGLDQGKVIVWADADLVHQISFNLIENAVKFTPEGGYIEIGYVVQAGKVHVSVKNSGAGIPKEELPRLFDRFYKTDKSRSVDKNGVGLGLHIVKSLVHLLSGEILVRSSEGEYCEFVFALPQPPAKRSARPFRKGEKQSGKKPPPDEKAES
jgi:signal transduction histidine kinase